MHIICIIIAIGLHKNLACVKFTFKPAFILYAEAIMIVSITYPYSPLILWCGSGFCMEIIMLKEYK